MNNSINIINTPLTGEVIMRLKAGDRVLISGIIYTARDAAHKRMIEALKEGKELPFDVKGQILYYAGPCPQKPPKQFGSCGPTTGFRMDAYTPELLNSGLKGMIGKGQRTPAVIESIIENKAIYFAAVGGAAAIISKSVIKADVIAYEDLGPEAIYRLEVKDFPCIVAVDSEGNDIYKTGPTLYKK